MYDAASVLEAFCGIISDFCHAVGGNAGMGGYRIISDFGMGRNIGENIEIERINAALRSPEREIEGFVRQPKDGDLFVFKAAFITRNHKRNSEAEDWQGIIHRVVREDAKGRKMVMVLQRHSLEIHGESEFKPREGKLFMTADAVTKMMVAFANEIEKHSGV
jgi:hypothetical protein